MNESSKAARFGPASRLPYQTVTASLDLAGKSDGTYYFNVDNDFSYANERDYNRFLQFDENMIISEVLVYSNPDVVPTDPENEPVFLIGGAENALSAPVSVPWAAPAGSPPVAPPGFIDEVLTMDDINGGAVNYYGHEGGHFPYFENGGTPDPSNKYKYLAVTINPVGRSRAVAPVAAAPEEEQRSTRRVHRRIRQARPRALPSGPVSVEQGRISVVLKVYPKTQ
jgi:hypothetical protein